MTLMCAVSCINSMCVTLDYIYMKSRCKLLRPAITLRQAPVTGVQICRILLLISVSEVLSGRRTYRHTKECIVQSDSLNTPHIRILDEFRINVKEDGHIDRLAFIESLLLETKALNLTEIWRHLRRRDAIRCDSDDVFCL